MQKVRETKSISLNEAERLRERDEVKAREEVRKTARAARSKELPPVYEITLKDASKPGLPPMLEVDEDKPSIDLLLEETCRILTDYSRLLEPQRTPAAGEASARR